MRAMKTILVMMFGLMFVATVCLAEVKAKSEEQVKEKTSATANISKKERRRIESFIDQLYRTKAVFAYMKQVQSLPDLEQKVAEYKKKLAEIKKNMPYDPDEKLPEKLENAKKIYGDKWNRIHSQLRSAIGGLVLVELLDTEFEPFVRFMTMYSGTMTVIPIEHRNRFAISSGINPYHSPDVFWKAYKDNLRQLFDKVGAEEHLAKLKEQYNVSDEIIETIRSEITKGWQLYGYKSFIDTLSPSDKQLQQTQKHLDSVKQKLNRYPNWKIVEKEMFPVKASPEKTDTTKR